MIAPKWNNRIDFAFPLRNSEYSAVKALDFYFEKVFQHLMTMIGENGLRVKL